MIESIKFSEVPPERCLPPGSDNAITVYTSKRRILLVPTSWSDLELWTRGLSLLMKKSSSASPVKGANAGISTEFLDQVKAERGESSLGLSRRLSFSDLGVDGCDEDEVYSDIFGITRQTVL